MDEQQATKGKEQESSKVDTGKGSISQKASLIEQANAAAERLSAENDRSAELLSQAQELEARRALGGRSGAPQGEQKKTEISNVEYLNLALAGKLPEVK